MSHDEHAQHDDHHDGHAHHDDHHEGLEPKLTVDELKDHRGVVFTGADGRQYQAELPGSWSNAKVAAQQVDKVCMECRDSPHFDMQGYDTNRELAQRINQAFEELKPGKGFVLAWRLYAEKDHSRWKVADGCGCGCGCYSAPGQNPPAGETDHGNATPK